MIRRQSHVVDELIDGDRIMADRIENTLLRLSKVSSRTGRTIRRRRLRENRWSGQAAEMRDLIEYVHDRFHQLRTIANERMTTARQSTVHRPRNREDFASLVGREAGGNQRATTQRRLDDEDSETESGDQAVPAWEVRGQRRRSRRTLGDHRPRLEELAGEPGVRLRIDSIRTGGQDRHARRTGVERAPVSGGIDSASQPAGDDQSTRRKLAGEHPSPIAPAACRGPGADDGDLGAIEDPRIAAAVEHRRRARDGGEPNGVATRSNRHDGYSDAPEAIPIPADDVPIDTAYLCDRRVREPQHREFTFACLEQPADASECFQRPQDGVAVARRSAADREPTLDVGFGERRGV